MSQPRIIVLVAADGTTQIRPEGFQGSGCLRATASLEQALGQSAERRTTSEFFVTTQTQTDQHVAGGE